MSARTLSLVLFTALPMLAGCATTQTAPREDSAGSASTQLAEGEHKGCSCALRPKAQGGSEQLADGKNCGCPHCAKDTKAGAADEAHACRCSHHTTQGQVQARDGE